MSKTISEVIACLVVIYLTAGQSCQFSTVTLYKTTQLPNTFSNTHTAATHLPSASHNVKTGTLPSPGIRVDSFLPVIFSRKVAFSVRKATEPLQADTRIHFRDVLANVGGSWNPESSEFLAPYDGKYFFIFHAIGGRTSDFTMALMKNGKFEVTAYGTLTAFKHGSNSAVLELKREDKVSLKLQQGAIYEHSGNETYTTFTGFLVF
nr:cerebellin-2-like [Procambarus clarkii]